MWLVFVSVVLMLQEKGTTPLHVAAKAGQILQAELLVVYGADPGALDINRRTPMDYARYNWKHNYWKRDWNVEWMRIKNDVFIVSRQAGHVELAERLVECQYELTDRLAFYLCGRRPGDHFTWSNNSSTKTSVWSEVTKKNCLLFWKRMKTKFHIAMHGP